MSRIRAALAFSAAAAVAAGVWYAASASPRATTPAAPAVSTTTASVTVGDVTQRVAVAGTLGYDRTWTVLDQLPPGIVTAQAGPGTVVTRGRSLFAVSAIPAVLLYGTAPAWRDFAAGMSDGPDVRQLERNLLALGMDPAHSMTVDDHLSLATTAAVKRWQAALGLPESERTGTLRLGQAVFLPGPVRVSEATAGVGARVAPGTPVMSATSTQRVVTAEVTTDQRHLVHVGDRVQVSLPTGAPVPGRIMRIGQVATRPSNPVPGTSAPPTVTVTVALRLPAASGDLDEAPVQLSITVASRHHVLMVPVTALLAGAGGGYQVQVVEAGRKRLVDVQPGLYDDVAGTVEVSGAGLSKGMSVEVPAP